MTKILLLHGWGGKKEMHWLTWLEQTLLELGHEVYFPKIPNNYNPNCDKWLVHIHKYVTEFQPDIVVAHSLGALAWWHYLSRHTYTLDQLISVAPPTFASFPAKMDSFFPLPELDFKESLHTILYAKDDKNIQTKDLEKHALLSHTTLVCRDEGEHLDHYSGIDTLPELLELLSLNTHEEKGHIS